MFNLVDSTKKHMMKKDSWISTWTRYWILSYQVFMSKI